MSIFSCFIENIDDIVCPNKDLHGPSYTQYIERFSIFNELKDAIKQKEMAMTEENSTTKQKNELHQLRYEVETCIHNLCEYCGHLARQTAEEEKAIQELEDLLDNEALVICDYKMKILACYFRENQKKFFGKRGTTTFGSMIVTNPEDVELKTKGVKDVSFVMLVTNDSLQDDWAVVCAKCYIYKECLPKHIKKVIFVADGAGCFKSKLHCAIQGLWKY